MSLWFILISLDQFLFIFYVFILLCTYPHWMFFSSFIYYYYALAYELRVIIRYYYCCQLCFKCRSVIHIVFCLKKKQTKTKAYTLTSNLIHLKIRIFNKSCADTKEANKKASACHRQVKILNCCKIQFNLTENPFCSIFHFE